MGLDEGKLWFTSSVLNVEPGLEAIAYFGYLNTDSWAPMLPAHLRA
jgi:hypothetical protein